MKIKFTESVTVPAGRDPELNFKKGSVHDLSEASAYRWIKRAKAVVVVVEEAKPTLKVGRPMMAEKRAFKPSEIAKVFSVDEPAKKPAKRKTKTAARAAGVSFDDIVGG